MIPQTTAEECATPCYVCGKPSTGCHGYAFRGSSLSLHSCDDHEKLMHSEIERLVSAAMTKQADDGVTKLQHDQIKSMWKRQEPSVAAQQIRAIIFTEVDSVLPKDVYNDIPADVIDLVDIAAQRGIEHGKSQLAAVTAERDRYLQIVRMCELLYRRKLLDDVETH